jgi:hypothetical protein
MLMSDNIKQILKQKLPFGEQIASATQQWKRDRKKAEIKSKNSDVYNCILSAKDGNALIAKSLADGSPFMVSRFGDVEAECVYEYLADSYEKSFDRVTVAGLFPINKETLDKFSQIFLRGAEAIDVLGVWFQHGEPEIIRRSCQSADLIPLSALEPYFHDAPWSKMLEGKRVLVIHPFASSISEQYEQHRKLLFRNERVLPEFELITLKAVQSFGGTKTNFDNWFDAYYWMRDKIEDREFDVAILGCGAYGLPLAAHIKLMGKQAIHLGGATQLLFGIRGKRWDAIPFYQSLYNEHWVRPKKEEVPQKLPLNSYW